MNTHPARGMRDFLPEDVRRRQYVIGVVADVFQRYGFEPLETPAIENIETLMGKYGEEGDRLIFRILKRGEEGKTGESDLALRYDLTVPLARVVAEYRATLPKFFKRYQVQPVWRADRPQKGRFREFYQCDVDTIGSKSMVVEADLLAAASEVLSRLGFTSFRIHVNHRKILNGFLRKHGVTDKAGSVLAALDKMDKIGVEGVESEFDRIGLTEAQKSGFLGFFTDYGPEITASGTESNASTLSAAWQALGSDTDAAVGLQELTQLLELTGKTAAGPWLVIDPTLARGLSYYTGAVFEVMVPDLAGSLAGGGRYDDLIGMFLGEPVPACGISLGLERILVVMSERNMFPPSLVGTHADVMVTIWNANKTTDALQLAGELRAEGLRVDVYPDADKLGKQFKYASGRGVRYVTVVGDDEAARGEVAIKNLASGEQVSIPRTEVAAFVKKHLIPET
jgi:histidyl-tRNA synthetase